MQPLDGWSDLHTLQLCQHVAQHGTTRWELAAAAVRWPERLCALRWHALAERHRSELAEQRRGAKRPDVTKSWTKWEIGVLLLGLNANHVTLPSKKAGYAALAAWLPGRTASGVKQAYGSHVEGKEAELAAMYKAAGWPASLQAVLQLWPGPRPQPITQEPRLPAADRQAAVAMLARLTAAGQPLRPQQQQQQQQQQQVLAAPRPASVAFPADQPLRAKFRRLSEPGSPATSRSSGSCGTERAVLSELAWPVPPAAKQLWQPPPQLLQQQQEPWKQQLQQQQEPWKQPQQQPKQQPKQQPWQPQQQQQQQQQQQAPRLPQHASVAEALATHVASWEASDSDADDAQLECLADDVINSLLQDGLLPAAPPSGQLAQQQQQPPLPAEPVGLSPRFSASTISCSISRAASSAGDSLRDACGDRAALQLATSNGCGATVQQLLVYVAALQGRVQQLETEQAQLLGQVAQLVQQTRGAVHTQ